MQTFEPNRLFDFKKICLANPQPLQGGTYFTKLSVDSNPCYMQLPKCLMRQGIVETKRGKYCDLLYASNAEEELTNWVSTLEETCQKLIYDKRELWFHNELTKDDIDSMLSSLFRLYRGGQQLLFRTHIDINRQTGADKCVAYDEKHIKQNLKTLDIKKYIIPLICIEGIKFSSKSFEFETKLLQIMILEPEPDPIDICLIKHSTDLNMHKSIPLGNLIENKNENHSESTRSNNLEQDIEKTFIKTQENHSIEKVNNKDQTVNSEAVANGHGDVAINDGEDDITHADDNDAEVEADPEVDAEAEVEAEDNRDTDNIITDESVVKTTETAKAEIEKEDIAKAERDTATLNTIQANKEENDDGTANANQTKNDIENTFTIEEVHPVISDDDESVTLKEPNEVYYEIYKAARDKAKHMRRIAIEAFLEAKDIKTKYLLDDIEDSDEEEEMI